jgi:hypothetical protein
MSTRIVIAVLTFLLLVAAGVLLWTGDTVDAGRAPDVAAEQAPAAAPPAEPMQAPLVAPSAVQQAIAPVVTASAAAPTDPFKAFLEAAKNKPPASGAQAPTPTQPTTADPFKAAVEASRRSDPVPLVSPFGGKN